MWDLVLDTYPFSFIVLSFLMLAFFIIVVGSGKW